MNIEAILKQTKELKRQLEENVANFNTLVEKVEDADMKKLLKSTLDGAMKGEIDFEDFIKAVKNAENS